MLFAVFSIHGLYDNDWLLLSIVSKALWRWKNARSGGLIKKNTHLQQKMLLFSHICSSIYNCIVF